MKSLKKILSIVAVALIISGCGGGGGSGESGDGGAKNDTKDVVKAKYITSGENNITEDYLHSLLDNNSTELEAKILLDDNQTEAILKANIKENNITSKLKGINFKVNKYNYDDGQLKATIYGFSSSYPLKNVTAIINDKNTNSSDIKKSYKVLGSNSNEIKISYMSEAPIFKATESNFKENIKAISLKSSSNNYMFTIELKEKILGIFAGDENTQKRDFSNWVKPNLGESIFKDTKKFTAFFDKDNKIHKIFFGKKIIYPIRYNVWVTEYTPFVTYKFVADFIGLNRKYTVAETNLAQTRVDTSDVLNNFDGIAETKEDPYILDETVTHRITDFDKLLSNTTTIPKEWQKSKYTKNRPFDDGRLPLILVHGWDGTIGYISRKKRREPTELLLWENAEFHYWHNFLSYYLSSKDLQKKYHIYLYRYTSYKHVSYNAKIFRKLLKEVPSNSDLGKYLKQENGVTIMAHSMGGMVSRAMIEEYNGLGDNAKYLRKLITLDTPHHGSVGSANTLATNIPKDLFTHGAMDLNYDNFDNRYTATQLNINFNQRREAEGLKPFDKIYCNKLNYGDDLQSCLNKTANPYMKYLNNKFATLKDIYSRKYIFYTAWNVHDVNHYEKILDAGIALPILGPIFFGLRVYQEKKVDLSKNYSPSLNFIKNGAMDISTAFIGNQEYSAGGAETVGSSIFSSRDSTDFNPLVNKFPGYLGSFLAKDAYVKSLKVNNICTEYYNDYTQDNTILTGAGSTDDAAKGVLKCIKYEDVYLSLITNSSGEAHPYKIPYRIFWDYDHETIFNGTAKDRGTWDKYISKSNTININTDKDTKFNSHRLDYIIGAMHIRYGDDYELSSSKRINPLKNEPVFLVLEKDLLDIATNNDIDEDGLPNKWEEENDLDWNNPDDVKEDPDNDGLTNLEEYQNGTDPQNEDSDGDGFKDGDEVAQGTSPNDKNDYPNIKNTPPVANAGEDQIILIGEDIVLDGSKSSDANDILASLKFIWKEGDKELGKGKSISLDNLSVGTHKITLTVTDPRGASSTDEVVITVVSNYENNETYQECINNGGTEIGCRVGIYQVSNIYYEPSFTSSTNNVKVIGDTAYVLKGGNLKILDIVDKRNPKEISSLNLTSLPLMYLQIIDDTAFIKTTKKSIYIVDISDKNNPVLKSNITTDNSHDFFMIKDNYLLSVGNDKITTYDISDIANPKKVKTTEIEGLCYDRRNSCHQDNYIYSLAKINLKWYIVFIDISNPIDIKVVNTYELPKNNDNEYIDYYHYVSYVKNHLIIQGGNINGNDEYIFLYKMDDKVNLTLKNVIKTKKYIDDIVYDNNYIYISKSDTVIIYDYSLNLVNRIYHHDNDSYIDINNNYLFMADEREGLKIFDISNLKESNYKIYEKSIETYKDLSDLKVDGNYIYIAFEKNSTRKFDISDPLNLIEINKNSVPSYSLGIDNNHLYSTTYTTHKFNIFNKNSLEIEKSIELENTFRILFINNGYAYLGGNKDNFVIKDIRDINHIQTIFYEPEVSQDYRYRVNGSCLVNDKYLLIIRDVGGEIYDITNLDEPTEISSTGNGKDIACKNNIVWIISGGITENHIRRIIIEDSSTLSEDSFYNFELFYSKKMIEQNNYLFALTADGVRIIDISDINNPKFAGRINLPLDKYSLSIKGDYIYVGISMPGENSSIEILNWKKAIDKYKMIEDYYNSF